MKNLKRIQKKDKGFTMIEILIVISVFTLALGIIYGSYSMSQKA